MIRLYQGVDIVEISKLKDIILRNDAFIREIFTDRERVYCESMKKPYIHFAGRFAAKESCLKALGTGLSGIGIDHIFQEIEVVPDASGKPHISVSGWAEKISKLRRVYQLDVSISHCTDYAVATVILLAN